MAKEERINLLFIFTDEQRADTMAAYGNNRIEVPNLNRLAREGIVFKKAYATQPICTPSRASIMTGLYPHTMGCVRNNIPLPSNTPTLPELADFSDYRKCYIGKWHLGDEIFCQHGFDEWISTMDGYRRFYSPGRDRYAHSSYHEWLVMNGFEPPDTTRDGFKHFSRPAAARLPERFCKPSFQAQEASRFIRRNYSRPFMLYINFLEPHMPFFGPRDDQHNPEEVALPENFDMPPTKDQPSEAQHKAEYLKSRFPAEADWRQLIARYWGLVSQVDTAIGRILETVREFGLGSNTIIVFTSDHGDLMGSHRLIAKGFQFEEATRVPLIIRAPDHCSSVVEDPVSQIDLVPTLLDLMGKPVPRDLEGYSWKPRLDDTGEIVEKNVFIEWTPAQKRMLLDHPVRTVITPEGWKLNWSAVGQHELYNLRDDPVESTNLFHRTEHRRLIQNLTGHIKEWQTRTADEIKLPEKI